MVYIFFGTAISSREHRVQAIRLCADVDVDKKGDKKESKRQKSVLSIWFGCVSFAKELLFSNFSHTLPFSLFPLLDLDVRMRVYGWMDGSLGCWIYWSSNRNGLVIPSSSTKLVPHAQTKVQTHNMRICSFFTKSSYGKWVLSAFPACFLWLCSLGFALKSFFLLLS